MPKNEGRDVYFVTVAGACPAIERNEPSAPADACRALRRQFLGSVSSNLEGAGAPSLATGSLVRAPPYRLVAGCSIESGSQLLPLRPRLGFGSLRR